MFGGLKPLTTKLKAAIYVRVSTAQQAKDGNSMEDQLLKCRAAIQFKEWEEADIYCNEKGISGTTTVDENKELHRLMEDAGKKKFHCVVFNSLDRLGRSTKIVLGVIEKFTELGIKIYSCKEFLDTSTASGELMLTFFAGIAQYERRLIIERMAAGKAVVATKYGEKGGPLPLGYRRGEDANINIHPREAAIVRNIFLMRARGLSLRKISVWLNNLKVKTRRGKIWYASTVKIILDNKAKYEGEERNGNENGIRWPKILAYSQAEVEEMESIERKKKQKEEYNSSDEEQESGEEDDDSKDESE